MDTLTIVLRIVHIFAGVFWVGSSWMFEFFLAPTVEALGPDGGKFMGYLMTRRRMGVFITVAAILTVLAGWTLFFMHYGIAGLSTPVGVTFAIGGIIGLIALVIGGAVTGPTATKMAKLGGEIAGAGKPPTPDQQAEMGKLQKRLKSAGLWTAILTSLALLMMASARYI
jgi:uncharacterized membrane protein